MSEPGSRRQSWRHATDDELYRIRMVWLGPPDVFTVPVAIRYSAYGVFTVVFLAFILVEKAFGVLGGWPVIEVAASIGITHFIMRSVSHETPLDQAVWISRAWMVTWIRMRARRRVASTRARVGASVRVDRGGREAADGSELDSGFPGR